MCTSEVVHVSLVMCASVVAYASNLMCASVVVDESVMMCVSVVVDESVMMCVSVVVDESVMMCVSVVVDESVMMCVSGCGWVCNDVCVSGCGWVCNDVCVSGSARQFIGGDMSLCMCLQGSLTQLHLDQSLYISGSNSNRNVDVCVSDGVWVCNDVCVNSSVYISVCQRQRHALMTCHCIRVSSGFSDPAEPGPVPVHRWFQQQQGHPYGLWHQHRIHRRHSEGQLLTSSSVDA